MPHPTAHRQHTEAAQQTDDLSYLRDGVEVLAACLSDLHLSHRPPLARSCEEDWYRVQHYYLAQVERIRSQYNVPCLLAGDIFHSWKEPSECVNFALKRLPRECLGIPGQHDLPYHRYDDIDRTPYWTLVASKRLVNLVPWEDYVLRPHGKAYLRIAAFPWGIPLRAADRPRGGNDVLVALAHKYVWADGKTCYPGAEDKDKVESLARVGVFQGYDALVFGDNHKGFLVGGGAKGPTVYNCGTFIRRRADEYNFSPRVGLLLADGNIEVLPLDTTRDVFLGAVEELQKGAPGDLQAFIGGLEALEDSGANFREAVERAMEAAGTRASVRNIVLESIEKAGDHGD
jgi:DNA repair exonuclease SbcCD nuclease subunit